MLGGYSCWSFRDRVHFAIMVPITTAIATEERLNTNSTLPPSLVNIPVLGTTMSSSSLSSSSSVFGSTILKVALAFPESGSVKYASKECSPSARVLRRVAGRVIVWLSGSTMQFSFMF